MTSFTVAMFVNIRETSCVGPEMNYVLVLPSSGCVALATNVRLTYIPIHTKTAVLGSTEPERVV